MTKNTTTKKKSTQHKKPRNNRRQTKKTHRAPLWAWVVIGLLVAALITLLLYLSNRPPNTPKKQPVAQTKEETVTPQPRFDFYEILKEREITVPDRSAEIKASIPDDINYFLQAGSFKNNNEADKLRAELLLGNMEAHIEPSTRNGQTWYRVITGPFSTRSKMAKARSVLASRGMSPLLLKRKKQ